MRQLELVEPRAVTVAPCDERSAILRYPNRTVNIDYLLKPGECFFICNDGVHRIYLCEGFRRKFK